MQYAGGRKVHIQTVPHVTHEGSKFPTARPVNPQSVSQSIIIRGVVVVVVFIFSTVNPNMVKSSRVGFEFHYANAAGEMDVMGVRRRASRIPRVTRCTCCQQQRSKNENEKKKWENREKSQKLNLTLADRLQRVVSAGFMCAAPACDIHLITHANRDRTERRTDGCCILLCTYLPVICTLKLNVMAIIATMMSAMANDTTK